jgi:hypothetical protein
VHTHRRAKFRLSRERSIQIEFPYHLIAVDNRLSRQDLEAIHQLFSLTATVSLDQTGGDILAARPSRSGQPSTLHTSCRRLAQRRGISSTAPALPSGKGKQGFR